MDVPLICHWWCPGICYWQWPGQPAPGYGGSSGPSSSSAREAAGCLPVLLGCSLAPQVSEHPAPPAVLWFWYVLTPSETQSHKQIAVKALIHFGTYAYPSRNLSKERDNITCGAEAGVSRISDKVSPGWIRITSTISFLVLTHRHKHTLCYLTLISPK